MRQQSTYTTPAAGAIRSSARKAIAILATIGAAALLVLGQGAAAQMRTNATATQLARATQISATIYGAYDYGFEGTGAWVGFALVKLGEAPAKTATFVDRNTSFDQRQNGAIYGTEVITFTFTDGSGTFEVQARFEGTPAATPGLYNLHETGTIANGTGLYSGASGSVSVEGPFLFPDPSITSGSAPWIAAMHGAVLGINAR
ncbi:MAG: hypothetical protein J0H49_31260 [Acidobacteria bacterium]|nr:hypothetical protein [Acidobacteriota bacterium]